MSTGGSGTNRIIIEVQQARQAIKALGKDLRAYNNDLLRVARAQRKMTRESNRQLIELNKSVAALKNVGGATGNATKKTNSFVRAYKVMASTLNATLAYRGVTLLQTSLNDAVKEAKDLSVAIAEIRTISQKANISTKRWTTSLYDLSESYGLNVADNAESAYQALSNQINGLANATNKQVKLQAFLTQQNRLASTTQATLAEATAVTTSVLNGYKLQVEDTSRVNAILFKTIEDGRLRLSEMANTLGRVNNLSRELGITFIEQQAALATLTRQGLQFAEAVTLLRNLELKLIKPTEKMKELFVKWGVSSGKAAIETFGFVGVLKKFAKEASESGDEAQELGEIFNRLRALVGFQGLASSFDTLDQTIKKMKESNDSFGQAVEEVYESLSKKVDRELASMRRYLSETFGRPALEVFANFSEAVGGAEKALQGLIVVLGALFSATLFGKLLKATKLTTKALIAFASTLGFIELTTNQRFLSRIRRLTQEFDRLNEIRLDEVRNELNQTFIEIQDNTAEQTRKLFQFVSKNKIALSTLEAEYKKAYTNINSVVVSLFDQTEARINEGLRKTQRQIDDLNNFAADREKQNNKRRGEVQDNRLIKGIVGGGDIQAALLELTRQRDSLAFALEQALEKGDFDKATLIEARVNRFEQEIDSLLQSEQSLAEFVTAEENNRYDLVMRRLKAEKEGIEIAKQRAKEQQKQLEDQKKIANELIETFQALESVELGDTRTFSDLTTKFQQLAPEAGLSVGERLNLNSKITELQNAHSREKFVQRQKGLIDELEGLSKEISAIRKTGDTNANNSRLKQVESFANTISEANDVATSLLFQLADLRNQEKNSFIDRKDPNATELKKAAQERRKFLDEQIRRLNALKNLANAGTNLTTLEEQQFVLDSINNIFEKLESTIADESFSKRFGDERTKFDFNGETLTADEILKQTRKTLDESRGFAKEAAGLQENQNKVTKEYLKMQKEIKDLLSDTVDNLDFKQLRNNEELNRLLRERLDILRQIKSSNQDGGGGGRSLNNAFGGIIGSDNQPTILTRGETVMTAAATQRFGPVLKAMNLQASTSTSNVTFGDVNINMPSGSSEMQVDHLISELKRRNRTGRFSI